MFIFAFLFFCPLLAGAAESSEVASEIRAPSKKDDKSFFAAGVNELYSETLYSQSVKRAATQTRLRHLNSLGIFPPNLKAFVGVSIDRELGQFRSSQLLQNSTSPTVGLLYQPRPVVSVWAEYRRRFLDATADTSSRSENDSRLGVAAGSLLLPETNRLNAEWYAEAQSVTRLTAAPVLSGHVRGFVRAPLKSLGTFDLYSEIKENLSPRMTIGPTYHQMRAGFRWSMASGSWSSALTVYQPWNYEDGKLHSKSIESLLVVGGYF